jgi:hypothetical protein
MNYTSIVFLLLFLPGPATAQKLMTKEAGSFNEPEKYISINFFSAAEPQFALGPSFGIRFTERSEVFAEAAYAGKTPFYKNDWKDVDRLNGARLILQYRYHFLQRWKPLFNFGQSGRRRRQSQQPFMGIEFRIKPASFSKKGSFVNNALNDTINNYPYKARFVSIGSALIMGHTWDISSNGKWKLEVAAGIGAKHRFVKYKNLPAGYKRPVYEFDGGPAFRIPDIDEETGAVYFPCAIRLRFVLN